MWIGRRLNGHGKKTRPYNRRPKDNEGELNMNNMGPCVQDILAISKSKLDKIKPVSGTDYCLGQRVDSA